MAELKQENHLICDISRAGKLVELGCDPFTRAPESKVQFTQTEGSGTRIETTAQVHGTAELRLLEVAKAAGLTGPKVASPSAQVLRLVVGLLGLEVNERPNSWAEAWLSFKDVTFHKLGLSSTGEHPEVFIPGTVHTEEQNEWQWRVLRHLREHVDRGREQGSGTSEHATEQGSTGGAGGVPSYDWGPDFQEQLEIAEFALRRITHAVNVLQDPEKNDRPMILREFTEEMVLQVSADLRQWLEQLATLLSLYHVYLLDMEAERRRLATLLEEKEAKFAAGELERKNAVLRHNHVQAIFEEDRMKRRAEALLGIQLQGEDAKIYSQKDMDEAQQEWERNELEPLRREVQQLRIQLQEQRDKMKDKDNAMRDLRRGAGGKSDAGAGDSSLPKATLNLLNAALNAAAERTTNDALSRALVRLAESMQNRGGDNLGEIITEIHRIPILEKPSTPAGPVTLDLGEQDATGGEFPVCKCLTVVAEEFDSLENKLRQLPSNAGANKLSFLAAWARDTTNIVNTHLASSSNNLKGAIRWLPAPQWDLGNLGKGGGAIRTIGVNTSEDLIAGTQGGSDAKARQSMEAEWQRRMANLRAELEKKLEEAWAVAERERHNAEEALQRLAEETQKADQTLAELRRKLMQMEKLLKDKGLAKQAADAIWGAGLSEFMQGRDVFERLYRDALDRMRRLAESQARFFEETSTDFLKTIGSIIDPHLKLPGLDNYYQGGSALQTPLVISPRPNSHRSAGPGFITGRPPELYPSILPSDGMIADMAGGSEPLSVKRLWPPNASPLSSWPPQVPPEAQAARPLQTPLRGGSGGASVAFGGATAGELGSLTIGGSPAMQVGNTKGRVLSAQVKSSAPGAGGQRPFDAGRSGSNPLLISSASALNTVASDTAEKLPPLHVDGRGQGRDPSAGSREGQRAASRSRMGSGPELRSGSPVRELMRADRSERSEKVSLLTDKDSPLAIGSLRPPSLTGGSLLFPPESHGQAAGRHEQGSQRKPGSRPPSHPSPARLTRNAGALSMPQLGPPRLLVQSVGSVY